MTSRCHVLPEKYISDYANQKRSWRERLFTFPWAPLKRSKIVHSPRAWFVDDICYVSYETYSKLQEYIKNEQV